MQFNHDNQRDSELSGPTHVLRELLVGRAVATGARDRGEGDAGPAGARTGAFVVHDEVALEEADKVGGGCLGLVAGSALRQSRPSKTGQPRKRDATIGERGKGGKFEISGREAIKL